ncbi:MAG: hypothetical protein HY820_29575 [Acidobacteria bacterium]|nr:hypothetical protein [Acidobacteriota bacterium]
MKDPESHDPLDHLLNEWSAPEPPPALDTRIEAALRARRRPSLWHRFWSSRISIPAPAMAALVLILAAAFWWRTRNPVTPVPAHNNEAGYFTKVEAAGFQPLPDGAIRIIRATDRKGAQRP